MAKKSKRQQDNQEPEDQFVDLPEDRFEQIEKSETTHGPEKKAQGTSSTSRKLKQAQGQKDAKDRDNKEPELSREDLLADVRRTLATEEDVEEPKLGLFARLKNRLTKSPEVEDEGGESPSRFEFETEPEEDVHELVVKPKPERKKSASTKQEEKAIQEFFSDLEALADIVTDEPAPTTPEKLGEAPDEVKPEEVVAPVKKLPAKSEKDEVDFDAFRELALQEYDETKIEVEEQKPALQDEVRRTLRDLRPVERILLIAVGLLTVGALLASGIYIIVDSISLPTPMPTVEAEPIDIVHPTRLSLPGGWEFNLGEGRVSEGQWTPDGAEWLVGTEISRWVALPWSLQLEAVLRTLKSDDQIELTMSNFDSLIFNVYSIQQMTMAELLASDATTPSLLIVLYNDEEADGKFWVVKALP